MRRRLAITSMLCASLVAQTAVAQQTTAEEAIPAQGQTIPAAPSAPAPTPPAPTQGQPVAPPRAAAPAPAPAAAPAPAQPAPAPSEYPGEGASKRHSTSYFGAGVAYTSVLTRGSGATDRVGLLLEAGKNIPLAEQVDLGLRLAWGLTEFHRIEEWGKFGYDTGAWTTEAYSDVYDWTRKHSGAPSTHGLRLMGGFFAFIVLWFGYVVSAFAYVFSVFAPTTFIEGDITGNYNFSEGGDVVPYVKGGLGLMAYVHPKYDNVRGGLGPTFGFGIRAGGINVGATMTWSPPSLHGEPGPAPSHILAGGLTIGFTTK